MFIQISTQLFMQFLFFKMSCLVLGKLALKLSFLHTVFQPEPVTYWHKGNDTFPEGEYVILLHPICSYFLSRRNTVHTLIIKSLCMCKSRTSCFHKGGQNGVISHICTCCLFLFYKTFCDQLSMHFKVLAIIQRNRLALSIVW